ncbi:hypothetical protein BJ684DRAFT_14980 [Piptocephalis cylindrospora]|uniref:Lung seven transmembrane receptor-domain-containing protein n=1 Tax=Piptocephalis cylindrospora TaxID=1907219 RepID=A0A4P9Y6I5_9FUNG|nr:hypothetical protein BJ684DRAFT_14980 [Piptocephalis cylindrospora]|eukprot:RKP14706.1 hypothetical protein BJ684DRAFT_14980 [Piptocephalis cylindrospora]
MRSAFSLAMLVQATILALSLLISPSLGYMSFKVRNKVITAHTYDFFQVKYDYYDRPNGIVAFMNPSNTVADRCFFQEAKYNDTVVAQGGIKNESGEFYEHTVILLNPAAGAAVGCLTITQMSIAAVKYGKSLEAVGYPPASTLILASNFYGVGYPGGPLSEFYPSSNPRVSDGPPAMPTAFISYEDSLKLVGLVQRYIPAEVSQERGPWNDAFLDQGYVAYNWALFAFNVLMCVYGLYRFVSLLRFGSIKADIRTSVFVLGVISTIVGACTFPMMVMTLKYRVLIQVSSAIHNISFYLLLLLWSGVLSRVQIDRSFAPFRIMIYGAIASAIVMLIIGIARYTSQGAPWTNRAFRVVTYLIPSVEALAALLFLAYSVRFAVRMNEYSVTRDVRRALSRLTKLSVIGFVSFVILAVTNILSNDWGSLGSVTTTMALYISQNIAMTLRSAGIIYILNIAIPTDTTSGSSSGTSSGKKAGSSGWVAFSRGWRRALFGTTSQSSSCDSTGNRQHHFNSSYSGGESCATPKTGQRSHWHLESGSVDSQEKSHLTRSQA